MTQRRTRIPSKSSRNRLARIAARGDLVPGGDRTAVYLLLQLRKANRTICRLRACARAARSGTDEELRTALAALRPIDLEGRPPPGARSRSFRR